MKANEMIEKIKTELRKMKIGFCGVKWDCLTWRMDGAHWQVGSSNISLKSNPLNLEDAANMIKLLNVGN